MITMRGIYRNGMITFLDDPPVGIECEVLVNFLSSEPLVKIQARKKSGLLYISIKDPSIKLTESEIEILRLSSEGLTYHEIADKLLFNYSQIRVIFFRIYRKLNVHSKFQAVQKAVELGFLPQVQMSQDVVDNFGKRKLSQRELDILQLIYEGLNRKEIATKLNLDFTEVRNACLYINRKLRARNKLQAIRRGLELGFIVPTDVKK